MSRDSNPEADGAVLLQHTTKENDLSVVNASFHVTHWSVQPYGTGISRMKYVGKSCSPACPASESVVREESARRRHQADQEYRLPSSQAHPDMTHWLFPN